ncbi:hypothetical protein SUDANB6_01530 [Streptomyces sp. enrichment culture]
MTVGAATTDIASWPPLDDDKRAFGQQLLGWAADDSGDRPRLCLLRGAEGSGKSRLLAWFLAGAAGLVPGARPGPPPHPRRGAASRRLGGRRTRPAGGPRVSGARIGNRAHRPARRERVPAPGSLRRVWRLAAPELTGHHTDGVERAALLHAAAVGTDPVLAEYLRPLTQQHRWTAVWAQPDLPVAALAAVPGEAVFSRTCSTWRGARSGYFETISALTPAASAQADDVPSPGLRPPERLSAALMATPGAATSM